MLTQNEATPAGNRGGGGTGRHQVNRDYPTPTQPAPSTSPATAPAALACGDTYGQFEWLVDCPHCGHLHGHPAQVTGDTPQASPGWRGNCGGYLLAPDIGQAGALIHAWRASEARGQDEAAAWWERRAADRRAAERRSNRGLLAELRRGLRGGRTR